MKKITIPFALVLFLCLTTGGTSFAGNIKDAATVASSDKAAKNFTRYYPGATNAQWTFLKDNGTVCRFSLNGVVNMAHYAKNGSWMYTIATYEENGLAADIRKMVKSSFYDFSISAVSEITAPGKQPVYQITIQDEHSLKILSLQNGDLQVEQEFDK
jgi:hypothetical protein